MESKRNLILNVASYYDLRTYLVRTAIPLPLDEDKGRLCLGLPPSTQDPLINQSRVDHKIHSSTRVVWTTSICYVPYGCLLNLDNGEPQQETGQMDGSKVKEFNLLLLSL